MDIQEEYPKTIQEIFAEGLNCKYCGNKYSENKILFSSMVYGVFFLLGKEKGYFGINCSNPDCNKTILLEIESEMLWSAYFFVDYHFASFGRQPIKIATQFPTLPDSDRKGKVDVLSVETDGTIFPGLTDNNVTELTIPSNFLLPPVSLKYFSSVSYSPKQFQQLDGSGIHTWKSLWCEQNEITAYESELGEYETENPSLSERLYCSYLKRSIQPQGEFTVWWFTEDQIGEICDIENESKRRIFPRYAMENNLLESIDKFCWDHYLEEHYLSELLEKNESFLTAKRLDPASIGMSDDEIVMQYPDFILPEQIKSVLDMHKNHVEMDAEKHATFFSILTAELCSGLSMESLRDRWLSEVSTSSNRTKADENLAQKQKLHKELLKKVTQPYQDGKLNTLLNQLSRNFILEYIKHFQTQGFNYSTVWELKERYLQDVFDGWISAKNVSDNSEPERIIINTLNQLPKRNMEEGKKCVYLAWIFKEKYSEVKPKVAPREIAKTRELEKASGFSPQTTSRWIAPLWTSDNLVGGKPPANRPKFQLNLDDLQKYGRQNWLSDLFGDTVFQCKELVYSLTQVR